jgi:hypothetical protein
MREIAGLMIAAMDDVGKRARIPQLRDKVHELTAQFGVP